jgi:hypothetical protein
MKKDLNKSCPDITDKNSTTTTIFTIKEEKEELSNTIKINENKDKEQDKQLSQLGQINIRDKGGNKSVSRSVNKNQVRSRPASSVKDRSNYNSNAASGRTKLHEDDGSDVKKNNKGRLSIPKGEHPHPKIPPSSDRKDETKKPIMSTITPTATAVENKDSKKIVSDGQKNKLREINKVIATKKKESSKLNRFYTPF